jgi:hypothetical protein
MAFRRQKKRKKNKMNTLNQQVIAPEFPGAAGPPPVSDLLR